MGDIYLGSSNHTIYLGLHSALPYDAHKVASVNLACIRETPVSNVARNTEHAKIFHIFIRYVHSKSRVN